MLGHWSQIERGLYLNPAEYLSAQSQTMNNAHLGKKRRLGENAYYQQLLVRSYALNWL
jgi:hypothetical protein